MALFGTTWRHWTRAAAAVLPVAAVVGGIALGGTTSAQAADEDKAELNARCATRLSIALLGQNPQESLMKSTKPQASVDAMIGTPAFAERFSRFINSQFNSAPGGNPGDDAVYYLARTVITKNRPWADLFTGKYRVDNGSVVDDPNGLGYFRSPGWMRRYAGNEEKGYRIAAAYRMINNTVGIELVATTAKPGEDRTATGRTAPACRACHYDQWYALDKVAMVLTKKVVDSDPITFTAAGEGAQKVLDGVTVTDDASFIKAMVGSTQHKFNTCRLVFQYLYGRPENTAEGALFDTCVDAYTEKGTIQAAVATIAKSPGFCQ